MIIPINGVNTWEWMSPPKREWLLWQEFHSTFGMNFTPQFLLWKNTSNEAMDWCVRTFDARCRVGQSASEQLQLCEFSGPTFGFTLREFSTVGGYTENPENHKTVKIGGWMLARVWALARDNKVKARLWFHKIDMGLPSCMDKVWWQILVLVLSLFTFVFVCASWSSVTAWSHNLSS